ncbi:perlucin-like [Dreissena polymorpha]|uniref:perlucin-like n=1 Tax=Dreissena polymorpha TaxID=45954 RepID=UPI0022653592|nr:perlucin-like [Dreissena polymorpha]
MQFWTDGTDKDTEGTWIWDTTGEPFEVTDWYPGEPNQHEHNEDCLTFYLGRYDYHWNDNHCDLPKGFICEKETTPLQVVG